MLSRKYFILSISVITLLSTFHNESFARPRIFKAIKDFGESCAYRFSLQRHPNHRQRTKSNLLVDIVFSRNATNEQRLTALKELRALNLRQIAFVAHYLFSRAKRFGNFGIYTDGKLREGLSSMLKGMYRTVGDSLHRNLRTSRFNIDALVAFTTIVDLIYEVSVELLIVSKGESSLSRLVVPWEKLAEAAKEKDYDTVIELSTALLAFLKYGPKPSVKELIVAMWNYEEMMYTEIGSKEEDFIMRILLLYPFNKLFAGLERVIAEAKGDEKAALLKQAEAVSQRALSILGGVEEKDVPGILANYQSRISASQRRTARKYLELLKSGHKLVEAIAKNYFALLMLYFKNQDLSLELFRTIFNDPLGD